MKEERNVRELQVWKNGISESARNGEQNNEILYSLMKKAGAAHSDRIIECRKGLGVERHMFGLEQMYYLNRADLRNEGIAGNL